MADANKTAGFTVTGTQHTDSSEITSSSDGLGSDDGPEESAVGRKIGRYVIQRRLGAGGMGVVYEARDLDLERDVAIKLMRTRAADGLERQRVRVLREAQAMAKLSHPNVVTVFEVGQADREIYIAMELVAGMDLKRWMAAKPRSWRRVLEVYRQAGQGLAAAHAAGLVHRDFKPENALLGNDGRVRVLDFGLARRVNSTELPDELAEPETDTPGPLADILTEDVTRAGTLVGTPAYMAPEQYAGAGSDSRTDQFAFCIALWEALYGERPFAGPSLAAIATNVLAGQITPPPTDRKVPVWLRRVLERGLCCSPDDRYPSLDALLAVLEELDTGPKTDARARKAAEHPVLAATELTGLVTSSASISGREQLIDDRYQTLGPFERGQSRASDRRFRAIDRLSGRQVVLVDLGPLGQGPRSEAASAAVRRKVLAVASLRHPNLLPVRDFVIGPELTPILVYELALEPAPFTTACEQPLALRVDIIAQLLRVVGHLHRHGITQLGLGRNVGLFDGKPKIFDLGDAVLGSDLHDQRVARFLAPELLRGEAGDARSDLFSVGVLAYELLTGRPPYPTTALDWGARPPSPIDRTEVPELLAQAIEGLLAYAPADRPDHSDAMLAALAEASGRPIATETLEIRENQLQAAQFVGREAELAQFEVVLDETLAGRGSAWLLAGESGIGKSRLLSEVQAQARIRGVTVAVGRGVRDATSPFATWQAVLHRMLLGVPIADDEALVLATVLPTLPQILGRSLSTDAPATDAEGARDRFIDVVGRVLRRRGRPLLIVLEDLHWARPECLALASALADLGPSLPVALLGSYREDENPTLSERLPGWRIQRLSRLTSTAFEALTRAMWGGLDPKSELVRALYSETEGNPLFLVEIIRALADADGSLAEAANRTSLSTRATGGVRRLIQRRLEVLSDDARSLLVLAALAGREIDPRLLTHLALDRLDQGPATSDVRGSSKAKLAAAEQHVDQVLRETVEATVLEHDGQDYRFQHERLREALIDDLSPEDRAGYHARIAAALESLHPDNPASAAALVRHHAGAGNIEAEARYAARAGEFALDRGADVEGARLLERALTLPARATSEVARKQHWHRVLSEVYVQLGDHEAARRHIVALLGSGSQRHGWLLARGAFRQLWHLLTSRGDRSRAVVPGEVSPQREQSRAAALDSLICVYDNDQAGVLAKSLLAVNLAEQAVWTNVGATGMLGFVAGSLGWRRLAERYFSRANAAVVAAEDERSLALARAAECGFRVQEDDLSAARTIAAEGSRRARGLADRRNAAIFELLRSGIAFYAGSFEPMYAHAKTGWELLGRDASETSSDSATIARAVGLALCMIGRLEAADRFLVDHSSTLPDQQDGTVATYVGTQALVATRLGQLDEARKYADIAYARFTNPATLTGLNPQYFLGCIEAYLALHARSVAANRADAGLFARRAARVQGWQRRWAKMCPVGRPQTLLYESRVARLRSRERALQHAQQALECAKQRSQPYIEALAHRELWSLHDPKSSAAISHYQAALDLFEQVGARHDRDQLQQQSTP